jgi:hypothetical protein
MSDEAFKDFSSSVGGPVMLAKGTEHSIANLTNTEDQVFEI